MQWIVLLISIVCLPLAAVEKVALPSLQNPKDKIVLVLDQSQLDDLLPTANFNGEDGHGVCFGLDRINLALLSNVQFAPGKRQSNSLISHQLYLAATAEKPQTVYGFESRQAFIQKMTEDFEEKENPLRTAIEQTQKSQRGIRHVQPRELESRTRLEDQIVVAESLRDYLDSGFPISVGLFNDLGNHAITVIGYYSAHAQSFPTHFYVLDSNFPKKIHSLILENEWTTPEGEIQDLTYADWFYPSWEEGRKWRDAEQDEIERRREEQEIEMLVARAQARGFPKGSYYLDLYLTPFESFRFKLLSNPKIYGGKVFLNPFPLSEEQKATYRKVFRKTVHTSSSE